MELSIEGALDLIHRHALENQSRRKPAALYDPRNYIMGLGGKKLRSLLCLMGFGLYRDSPEKALDMAYAIELFHNFSLVHDDIMDNADKRRGKDAVHIKYDTNSAILTGDVMLIEVYERLSEIDPSPPHLIRRFNQVAREVCEGQSMDMEFETSHHVSIKSYLRMIELKTAVLIGFSLESGAFLAGASESDQLHLYHFGVNAGIAFQLQDDYLDVYGDASQFGKKVGGDIIQGKKTYLYLRALKLLDMEARTSFKALYEGQSPDKVSRVTKIFDELYLSHYCEEAKNSFFNLAVSHMDMVKGEDSRKDALIAFSKGLFERNK